MNPADESAAVDPAELARLLAVAAALQTGVPGSLPDRLAWESECLQLLDRVWPRIESASGDDLIPATVGRYEVIRELGRGGFGVVYLARDPNLGRDVAVKVPLPGMIAAPEVRRRFLREAQAVSGLDHPNIVPIHDAETVGPVAYIVSAFCPGPSLAAWLKAQTMPVSPRIAAGLVLQLTHGIAHAHERGIWHRDLKPANIMLQPGGAAESGGMTPRVTDFGLAKLADGSGIEATRTGLIIGSAPYMAPEQAESRPGEVGPATDVYALGATLYEILVGRPPFVGRSQGETFHLVLNTDPVPPQLLRREIPRDLQTICLHALRKHPGHRYPTAADLGADLARFLDDQPIQARPASLAERGWGWARRHPGPASSIAAGVVLIAALGGLMAWSNRWLRSHNDQLQREVHRADHHAAEADRQRRLVADREAITDRHLHAARLNLAQQAINAGQNERAQLILADANDATGTPRHDFAWHYLWNLARRDLAIWGHHPSPIQRFALAPDGATFASGDQVGGVQLWDIATERLKTACGGPYGQVRELAFSPDGTRLAVVGETAPLPSVELAGTCWDVASGRLLGRFDLPGIKQVRRIWFADEGRTLVALGTTQSDAEVILGWDLTLVATATAPLPPRFTVAGCLGASGSPDGRSVWTLEQGGRLNQRATATGAVVRRFESDLPGLAAHAFSPDGRSLAGATQAGSVLVWDLAGAGEPQVVGAVELAADELIWRPDAAALLVVVRGFQARLIPLSGAPACDLLRFDPGRLGRLQFAFSPDGRWLVSTGRFDQVGNQPVTVWSGVTGRPIHVFPGRLHFIHARFDATSRAVLLGNDYDVAVWRPFAPPVEAVYPFDDHNSEVWSVAFSPDGQTLASGGNDHRLRLWNPRTRARSHVIAGHDATVATVAWHPNGLLLATGSLDESKNLRLWDARTGELIADLPGHTAKVRSIAFSPDGAVLASTGTDRTVRLWDGATGQPLGHLATHADVVRGVAFARNQPHLATVSNDRTVQVWDWSNRQRVASFEERYQVSAVTYSPDGATLASADEGGFIHLRDVTTWQTRRVFQSDDREVRALTFSPDGETLVAAGLSHTIRFWDPATGQPLMELEEGTSDQINALAFSPDGSLLIGADHGGRVLVYRGHRR